MQYYKEHKETAAFPGGEAAVSLCITRDIPQISIPVVLTLCRYWVGVIDVIFLKIRQK